MPKKSAKKTTKAKLRLSLIILNYNSQYWLKNLLTSLKEKCLNKTKYDIKVIIVDNNSQDDGVSILKKEFPQFELILLSENLGFSAGNNAALKKINTDYVMLLNNDTEFTNETNLDLLIDFMEDNPQIAVVTPQVLLPNGQLDMACHRGEPTPWASFTYYLGLEKLFPQSKYFSQYHQSYKNYDVPHQIDACSGAAMLIRTKAIKKVGLLDEQFFMYAEDLDWCRRFRNDGWQIVYLPQVKIIHHKYKSGIKSQSDVTATKIRHYFYNTMLQYYDKHHKNKYPRAFRWILKLFLFIKRGGF